MIIYIFLRNKINNAHLLWRKKANDPIKMAPIKKVPTITKTIIKIFRVFVSSSIFEFAFNNFKFKTNGKIFRNFFIILLMLLAE